MPERLQARMLEEWTALLDDVPGDLSKLYTAISLYWKRSKLAGEGEELVQPSLPTLVGLETLSEIEQAVFGLLVEGKTIHQISDLLNIPTYTVEYRRITSVQKLTGQPNIGRGDLFKFLGAVKNPRNQAHGIVRRFRREMRWRELRTEWWRNGGW